MGEDNPFEQASNEEVGRMGVGEDEYFGQAFNVKRGLTTHYCALN